MFKMIQYARLSVGFVFDRPLPSSNFQHPVFESDRKGEIDLHSMNMVENILRVYSTCGVTQSISERDHLRNMGSHDASNLQSYF